VTAVVIELLAAGPWLEGCKSFSSSRPAEATNGRPEGDPSTPSRLPPKLSAVGAAGLSGLGVFFAFDANTASHHDKNPSDGDKQSTAILTAAMYVSFGLALAAAVTSVVLLLKEPRASP
jgi:hypothetical protein